MNYKTKYIIAKLIDRIFKKNGEAVLNLFRKNGIQIGENTRIYSDIQSSEGYLISIGSNTTISSDVKLLTHDASIGKVIKNKTDLFGKICIGDNCFIGANSVILCGVSICNDVIVGAGSIVAKSISNSGVYAGNPARKICDFSDMENKYAAIAVNLNEHNDIKDVLKDGRYLIKK